jgi:hypothetical protein
MSDSRTNKQLLRQVAGALLWAVFFILAPTEVLLFGALVWIPLLIWCERRRALRYAFWPGIAARLGIVAIAIGTAALAPTQHEDGRVGPLPHMDISLGDLAVADVIYRLFDRAHDAIRVQLPSATPTRREVMRAITEQTGLRASVFHCGNGATVLFGSGVGRIRVAETHESVSAER